MSSTSTSQVKPSAAQHLPSEVISLILHHLPQILTPTLSTLVPCPPTLHATLFTTALISRAWSTPSLDALYGSMRISWTASRAERLIEAFQANPRLKKKVKEIMVGFVGRERWIIECVGRLKAEARLSGSVSALASSSSSSPPPRKTTSNIRSPSPYSKERPYKSTSKPHNELVYEGVNQHFHALAEQHLLSHRDSLWLGGDLISTWNANTLTSEIESGVFEKADLEARRMGSRALGKWLELLGGGNLRRLGVVGFVGATEDEGLDAAKECLEGLEELECESRWWMGSRVDSDSPLLTQILHHTPNLRLLSMTDIPLPSSPTRAMPSLPSLTHLSLTSPVNPHAIPPPTTSTLTSHILQTSPLTTLDLGNYSHLPSIPVLLSHLSPNSHRLESLRISSRTFNAHMKQFSPFLKSATSLTSFHLLTQPPSLQLINSLPPSITTLSFVSTLTSLGNLFKILIFAKEKGMLGELDLVRVEIPSWVEVGKSPGGGEGVKEELEGKAREKGIKVKWAEEGLETGLRDL
ncbi:hypothetical protein T439DRAFT_383234 [Meredithblackwellia eburnea MCA 4105]